MKKTFHNWLIVQALFWLSLLTVLAASESIAGSEKASFDKQLSKPATKLPLPELKAKSTTQATGGLSSKTQTPGPAAVNRPIKDKWALVIGISKFGKSELNLKHSDKDASDFAAFLVRDAHFKEDHVKVLLNEKATRKNILSDLGSKWLPRVAAPDDLVVLFISSHGSPSEMDREGVNYLVAYDTDPDDLYASGIEMQELMRMIKSRVHSDRVVIVLDACHSGATKASAKGLVREANIDAKIIAQGTGQLVIASSEPNQQSWEFKSQENSVFTKCLIEGLQKNGSATTLGEAFAFASKKVENTVLKERGKLQTPVLKSAWEGNDLVLAAIPSSPRDLPASLKEVEKEPEVNTSKLPNSTGGNIEKSSDYIKEASKATEEFPTQRSKEKSEDSSTSAENENMAIETDQVDLKRLGLLDNEDTSSNTRTGSASIKLPPLPNHVAIIPFSGPRDLKVRPLDYMNDPSILLQHMVSSKLKAALGRRLKNDFDSGSALANSELAAGTIYDKENIMSLGRAFQSRFIIDVSIERADFDKKGNCYFATILRIFDGETGELAFVEGKKAECPAFSGKDNEKSLFLRTQVLPLVAEQISQSILNIVNLQ
ncbi:MAG: caspase family protein [Candidatus Obscuribacterales bacterium]|nr:caspase family protein [Candidatus Obscuribacterales bacterium]